MGRVGVCWELRGVLQSMWAGGVCVPQQHDWAAVPCEGRFLGRHWKTVEDSVWQKGWWWCGIAVLRCAVREAECIGCVLC